MNKIWDEPKKINRIMLIGVAICLAFFSMTFYFYNEVSRSSSEDANSRVMDVSEQYRSAISNQISGDLSTLMSVSYFVDEKELEDVDGVLNSFDRIVKQNAFLRMSYTDQNGTTFLINDEGERMYDVNMLAYEYIQKALAGDVNVSASYKDSISGEYINCYAVPVRRNNEVVGCISAAHRSHRFYNLITSSIFGGKGETNIVDKNGDFVIRLYDGENGFHNLKDKYAGESDVEQLLNAVKEQDKAVFDITVNHKQYISVVIPLGINDWSINTVVPMSYFLQGYTRLAIIFLITSLLIMIVFVILFLFIRNILKDSRESIIKLAYYDSLTGMYNRNRFMDKAKELLNSKKEYVFVLLDVNDFKFINETYSYSGGNKLLHHIGDVLNNAIDKEELCFRDNADCFGLLLQFENKQKLEKRLNKIIDEIGKQHFDENYKVICNCGIKIIKEYYRNGKDIDMIFDRAKLALKRAKGNHVSTLMYFDEKMEEESHKRFIIENEMRSALEKHEFQMYLQPKIAIDSGKIIGAEALVRWVNNDKIKYYPDEFIPVFEANGFICELDLYMLEEACLCLKRGIEKGYTMIPISVNQSKVLFYRTNYLESLKHILDIYQVDPSLIIIEVTESITINNVNGIKKIIQGLHELGFKVSMDDFGSGYSSLNVLQKLDIDELKLDRDFLMADHQGFKQKKVIESVVNLAKELNISTVSEGVETDDQLSYLKSIHCDIVQGFYYSKPIPYEHLIEDIYSKHKWQY